MNDLLREITARLQDRLGKFNTLLDSTNPAAQQHRAQLRGEIESLRWASQEVIRAANRDAIRTEAMLTGAQF